MCQLILSINNQPQVVITSPPIAGEQLVTVTTWGKINCKTNRETWKYVIFHFEARYAWPISVLLCTMIARGSGSWVSGISRRAGGCCCGWLRIDLFQRVHCEACLRQKLSSYSIGYIAILWWSKWNAYLAMPRPDTRFTADRLTWLCNLVNQSAFE